MKKKPKIVEFVIPPEGIPVEPGTRAHRIWKVCLEGNGTPVRKDIEHAIGGSDA